MSRAKEVAGPLSPRGLLSPKEVASPRGVSQKDNAAPAMDKALEIFKAALYRNRLDFITKLLEQHPDFIKEQFSLTDSDGTKFGPFSAMSFFVRFNKPTQEAVESLTFLVEKGGFNHDHNPDGTNSLLMAAGHGKKEFVKAIIQLKELTFEDQGLNEQQQAVAVQKYINSRDSHSGGTVLHPVAVGIDMKDENLEAYKEIMIYLMGKGADLKIEDKSRSTPLKYITSKVEQVQLSKTYEKLHQEFLQNNQLSDSLSL
jgi:ankyrin repeat protein